MRDISEHLTSYKLERPMLTDFGKETLRQNFTISIFTFIDVKEEGWNFI